MNASQTPALPAGPGRGVACHAKVKRRRIALSAIRNSQFEIVRASFPVFILGWTIGAIQLAKSQFSRIINP